LRRVAGLFNQNKREIQANYGEQEALSNEVMWYG